VTIRLDENDRVYYELVESESHVDKQLFDGSTRSRMCGTNPEIMNIQNQTQDLSSDSVEKGDSDLHLLILSELEKLSAGIDRLPEKATMHSLRKIVENVLDEKIVIFGENMDTNLHNHSNDILISLGQL
jgi:hypothetical protein